MERLEDVRPGDDIWTRPRDAGVWRFLRADLLDTHILLTQCTKSIALKTFRSHDTQMVLYSVSSLWRILRMWMWIVRRALTRALVTIAGSACADC